MNSFLKIEEYKPISRFFTFKMGGTARYFSRISLSGQIPHVIEKARSLKMPVCVLGGGSNMICADGEINRFFIKMEDDFIKPVEETKRKFVVEVGAGTLWDDFVEYAVRKNVSGIEALSAIPGTVGAAPIQNIGAYGQEAKDVIISVRAYDVETNSFTDISAETCGFGYRDSMFKGKARGRFVIASVLFKLSKLGNKIPNYPDVEKYFAESKMCHSSPADIRNAVIAIRASKLPDPTRIPNAGSFFKNPVVSRDVYQKLLSEFPLVPSFAMSNNMQKIPAGWLIDQCGFKGIWKENAGVYEKNALVLIGNDKTTYKNLMDLKDAIVSAVHKKFGIFLEMEPDIVT